MLERGQAEAAEAAEGCRVVELSMMTPSSRVAFGNQPWLGGKPQQNGGFTGKITNEIGFFQQTMFDYHTVAEAIAPERTNLWR